MFNLTSTKIDNGRADIALVILRLSLAAMMLTHGWPKFLRLIDGNMRFGDPLGIGSTPTFILAVIAEFLGSIMLIIGLYSRVAAFLGACTMATAAFIAHADDPFGSKEKPLLFLAGYIVIILMGSGKFSLDDRLK